MHIVFSSMRLIHLCVSKTADEITIKDKDGNNDLINAKLAGATAAPHTHISGHFSNSTAI